MAPPPAPNELLDDHYINVAVANQRKQGIESDKLENQVRELKSIYMYKNASLIKLVLKGVHMSRENVYN